MKYPKEKGQALFEFAITLVVYLLFAFAIIEFCYLLFNYVIVDTASREAARYAMASGDGTGVGSRYYDCDGIIAAGLRMGSFARMDASEFTISYDSGPETSVKYPDCATLAAEGGTDNIVFGDRVVIEVNHNYQPIVTVLGLDAWAFTMSSTSHRTIIKAIKVGGGG
jgi:hypothetical protein